MSQTVIGPSPAAGGSSIINPAVPKSVATNPGAVTYETSSITSPGTRKPGQVTHVAFLASTLVSTLCNAAAAATAFCNGIITQGNDDTPVIVQASGIVELETFRWDAVIDGGSGIGLSPGQPYFVSDTTAGNITTTPPSTGGHFVTLVGWALSATQMLVQPLTPLEN